MHLVSLILSSCSVMLLYLCDFLSCMHPSSCVFSPLPLFLLISQSSLLTCLYSPSTSLSSFFLCLHHSIPFLLSPSCARLLESFEGVLASYPIGNDSEPVTIMTDAFVANVKAVSQDTFNGSEFGVPR